MDGCSLPCLAARDSSHVSTGHSTKFLLFTFCSLLLTFSFSVVLTDFFFSCNNAKLESQDIWQSVPRLHLTLRGLRLDLEIDLRLEYGPLQGRTDFHSELWFSWARLCCGGSGIIRMADAWWGWGQR